MSHLRRSLLVALVVLAAVGTAAAPAAAAPTSGVDDWSCRPSAAHPQPVVLLHGLGASGDVNWFYMAPRIAAKGFCVFTTTYGEGPLGPSVGGLRSMRDSAVEVGAFVDEVRGATGAAKVSIVGHSEGSTVGATYLKLAGGASKVRHFIGIAPNYKGTTLYGLNVLVAATAPLVGAPLDAVCAACREFLPPSSFLTDLQAGGITVAGPTYTTIRTTYDTVVVPHSSAVISEPGVRNITLQSECWLDASGHLSTAINPNVLSRILNTLDPAQTRAGCVPFFAPA